MTTRTNIVWVIFTLLQLAGRPFLLDDAAVEPSKIADSVQSNEKFLPVSIPEKTGLNFLSLSLIVDEGTIFGAVAVYDDPRTERSPDYYELYDEKAELVAVSWLDEFGIERTAFDRGFLQGVEKLEGVFVIVLDGDAV